MAPRNRRRNKSTGADDVHGQSTDSTTTEIPPEKDVVSTRVGGNPFQFKGSGNGFEAKAVEEGLYLTVDMPGVEDNGAEVWIEENELFFAGETKEVEFEAIREYGGVIDLGSDSGEISEMKIDMKNGVLRMILVGCTIQPESLNVSSTQPSDPSKLQRYKSKKLGKFSLSRISKATVVTPDCSRGIYPFQLSGPLGCIDSTMLGTNHVFVRVDMPDVPDNKKSVKFHDDVLLFGGVGEKWSEHDDKGCRGYFGRKVITCGCCEYVSVQSEIKNGVLRMFLEKKKIKGRKPFTNKQKLKRLEDYLKKG